MHFLVYYELLCCLKGLPNQFSDSASFVMKEIFLEIVSTNENAWDEMMSTSWMNKTSIHHFDIAFKCSQNPRYCQGILDAVVLPSFNRYFGSTSEHFNRTHNVKTIRQFCHFFRIDHFKEWLLYSPDLNPI